MNRLARLAHYSGCRRWGVLWVIALLWHVPPARAVDAAAAARLAGADACMGCHAVARRVVGPSFKSIAERYRTDPTATDKLVVKVKTGGAGNWGPLPMPPHPALGDADARLLVQWILAGAPVK